MWTFHRANLSHDIPPYTQKRFEFLLRAVEHSETRCEEPFVHRAGHTRSSRVLHFFFPFQDGCRCGACGDERFPHATPQKAFNAFRMRRGPGARRHVSLVVSGEVSPLSSITRHRFSDCRKPAIRHGSKKERHRISPERRTAVDRLASCQRLAQSVEVPSFTRGCHRHRLDTRISKHLPSN